MEYITDCTITYMEAFKRIAKLEKSGLNLLPTIGVHDSLYLATIKCGNHQYLLLTNENKKDALSYQGLALEIDGSPYYIKTYKYVSTGETIESSAENVVCRKFDQDVPFSVISLKKLY